MGSIFSPPKPSPPPAPKPVPTRDTAAEEREAARRRQRQSEAQRAGRAATILSRDEDTQLGSGGGNISRPQAQRQSRLLGS